jgi:ferredoxin
VDAVSGALRIVVDPELCVGSCTCLRLAPGVFAIGLDGHAAVADAGAADRPAILEAAENCPTGAIAVYQPAAAVRLFPPPA